jgi:hypothetical protein
MHPLVRRDLPLFGQLDHVYRRSVPALSARSTLQGGLKFPYRCIAWPADRFKGQARSGLAAIALDLKPTQSAVDALPDGR